MSERTATAAWTFDGFGSGFDAHVIAHLPGYEQVQQIVGQVSSFTVPDRGVVADLGASTGRTTAQIIDAHPARRITAHLYDGDASMLDAAVDRLARHPTLTLETHHGDLTQPLTWAHDGADLTLALWLLQFLHPRDRLPLFTRARDRSSATGAILVAAKVRHPDPRWQEIGDAALVDHKATAGVTPEEITAKARSLRGVLIPDTATALAEQLTGAGWHAPCTLWSWHAWVLIGAWASPIEEQERA